MAKINVLDKHVAELIAAGEVVERPSSVIKELVENSIDSGANAVTVEIQNGGITMMRVTDNGCGILREDIRNAFLRHATSKVKVQDDLESIGTLGFRGEALASIAAVARVDLLTKAEEEDIGTHYTIEGCDEVLMEDAGCPKGTTFVIRDLFYNVPARMKFLKKDVSEANAVAAVVDKIALSHPEVAFTFIRDNKKTLVTSGDGKLKNCIYAVFGREFTQSVVPVDYELNGVTVKGYVTKPQGAKASRSMQNFFINGRFVKSRTAAAALEEACKGMVMVGKFPACVLHIELSFSAVDVNVHPAKIEVRFVNEKPIFEAVYHGVRSALIDGDTVKKFQLDFQKPIGAMVQTKALPKTFTMSEYEAKKLDSAAQVSETLEIEEEISSDSEEIILDNLSHSPKNYGIKPVEVKPLTDDVLSSAPLESSNASNYVNIDIHVDDDEEENKKNKENKADEPTEEYEQVSNEIAVAVDEAQADRELNNSDIHVKESTDLSEVLPESEKILNNSNDIQPIIPDDGDTIKYIGEAFATYIIVEKNKELILVDKHALHERIIYEKLRRERGKKFAQYLLDPVAVTLSKEQYEAILDNKEILSESGFETDDFGGSTILVRSAPSFIDAFDVPATIEEMAEHILENKKNIESEYTDWLYHNIACRSAIKGGDLSSPQELINLYKTMETDPAYRYCPHGRPTSIVISKYQIEKQFGRV